MNLKIISLKHQWQGNLVSIIWKLFFRFCGFAARFYCAFGEKDVFKIWHWSIIFAPVKIFGVFFGGKIYKGHFYVLPPPGSVGKSVALWWDSEPPIIIPKLAKFWFLKDRFSNCQLPWLLSVDKIPNGYALEHWKNSKNIWLTCTSCILTWSQEEFFY